MNIFTGVHFSDPYSTWHRRGTLHSIVVGIDAVLGITWVLGFAWYRGGVQQAHTIFFQKLKINNMANPKKTAASEAAKITKFIAKHKLETNEIIRHDGSNGMAVFGFNEHGDAVKFAKLFKDGQKQVSVFVFDGNKRVEQKDRHEITVIDYLKDLGNGYSMSLTRWAKNFLQAEIEIFNPGSVENIERFCDKYRRYNDEAESGKTIVFYKDRYHTSVPYLMTSYYLPESFKIVKVGIMI